MKTKQKEFFTEMIDYWTENWDKPYIRDELTVDDVIGQFLFLMNRRVSVMCMNFLCRVMYYMREGLIQLTKVRDYCKRETPNNLPNFFNKLIMRKMIPPDSAEEEELMDNSTIICHILQYFGLWIYDERYTDYKVKPNY
jgi:hypothetical protein